MSTFDDRERAFEAKYKHDEETRFKVYARRAKLFGAWAAGQMGMNDQAADAYAREIVKVDFEEPGHEDILRKVLADLEQAGVEMTEHRLRKELERLLLVAQDQIRETGS